MLWEEGILQPEQSAKFYTLSGPLTATRSLDWITLNFPAEPAKDAPYPTALSEALGVPVSYIGRNRLDYIVELEHEDAVRSVQPNFC